MKKRLKDSPIDPHKVNMLEEEQRAYDELRQLPRASKREDKFTPAEARVRATNPSGMLEPLHNIPEEDAQAREALKVIGTRKTMKQLKDEVRRKREQPGDIFGKKK